MKKNQQLNNLTIDVGTTNTKVTLWKGQKSRLRKFATPKYIDGNYTNFLLEKLWDKIVESIKSFDKNDLRKVNKIAIASVGESGTLIDSESKKSVGECIAWFDERAQSIVNEITPQERRKLYSITGLPVHSHYSACKIAWLEHNRSNIFSPSKRYVWLCIPDYLVFKFSGVFATEYTMASRTLCLDLKTKNWSEEVKQIFGIQNIDFPKIYQSGEPIARVSDEFTHFLSPTCTVSIAGHDHMSGSNAAFLKKNELLDSTGTTEALLALVEHPDLSDKAEKYSLANGVYTNPKLYTLLTAMPSAGSTIEWFMKMFHINEDQLLDLMSKAKQDYDIGKVSSDVIVIPHFSGSGSPFKSTDSKGLIYGLTKYTTLKDVVFGLFLGLTFEFKITYNCLVHESISKIKVIGPAINDPLWLQLKADVMGLPVESIDVQQAVSKGAYILASKDNSNKSKVTRFEPTDNTKKKTFLKEMFNQVYKIIYFNKMNNNL